MLHLRLKKALGEFSITHVTDGKQAVQLVAEEGRDFDVVIMDNQVRPARVARGAARVARACARARAPSGAGSRQSDSERRAWRVRVRACAQPGGLPRQADGDAHHARCAARAARRCL